MTLVILFLLWRTLPDFFVRSLFWFKSLGRFRLKVVGMSHLPTAGPVILVTNCRDTQSCLQLVAATDRTTKVILFESMNNGYGGGLLRGLARRANWIMVRNHDVHTAAPQAFAALHNGNLLAICVQGSEQTAALGAFVQDLQKETNAPLLPVFCGDIGSGTTPQIRVVFGEVKPSLLECQHAIGDLELWIRANDASAGSDAHCAFTSTTPGVASAWH
jgi:hypothetical protein